MTTRSAIPATSRLSASPPNRGNAIPPGLAAEGMHAVSGGREKTSD